MTDWIKKINKRNMTWLLLGIIFALTNFGTVVYAQKYHAASLSSDQISQAIESAIQAVYENDVFKPPFKLDNGANYFQRYAGVAWQNIPQEIRNKVGNHALLCWALLATGESYQNPDLYKRINWVLSSDQPATYDRGMRMQMLSELPIARWRDWIRRDGIWLNQALGPHGNYGSLWQGTNFGLRKNRGQALKMEQPYGDNANGQYGVLGLWGAEKGGFPVGTKTWKAIDTYWREAQQPATGNNPAGWGIYSIKAKTKKRKQTTNNSRVSGPMTAGGVAVLTLTERYLKGPTMIKLGVEHVSPELRRGLRYLDKNFKLNDPSEKSDRYYYFWTMQSVSRTTGYGSFNGIDISRDVTATLLNEQQGDGAWRGPKGRVLSTGFALMYLGRAYDPLAISKLRFKATDSRGKEIIAGWNNHPHDLWNFTDYISDQYEYQTSWQISDLNQPAYSLIESPILYLATHAKYDFSKKQLKNLREYINVGGTLLVNLDRATLDAKKSLAKLTKQLFPKLKLTNVPLTHPIYNLHQHVKTNYHIQMINNGIRPMIIVLGRDIGQGLQKNETATSDSFPLLSNIYLYVVGKDYRRARLVNNYIPNSDRTSGQKIAAARITYQGNFDPEPGALQQLHNLMANKFNINLAFSKVSGQQLDKQKIAFLTAVKGSTLTQSDAQAIAKWVKQGGTLLIDAGGGSKEASQAAQAMMTQIFPTRPPVPVSFEDPILTGNMATQGNNCRWVRYRNFALQTMGPVNRPKLQGIDIDNRTAVLLSTEDITCGLAGLDHWEIFGYTPEFARKITANIVLSTLH